MSDEIRHKPVAWLAPDVLAKAGAEVVLSGLFANYADKRENMGGLSDAVFTDHAAAEGDFWFDYASDVGDGYEPTYRVAHAMAQEQLTVGGRALPGGRLLVLGGDEVYPSASWQAYQERFKAPYAAAYPEGGPPRDLFAIPGNHDWYDGLTSFMRLFCQESHVGGWQTHQKRSYFAIQLPRGWWLWGIDIQFDAYIDAPQIEYFKRAAALTKPGDQVILATAKPSWVHVSAAEPRPQSWMSVQFFTERIVCSNGATLALTVTGDLHHYSRYAVAAPRAAELSAGGGDLITAGGGGAYLSPTHWLPERLALPRVEPDEPVQPYELVARWPDRETSLQLRGGVLQHLWLMRTFSLNWLLAGLYFVLAWLLATGVRDGAPDFSAAVDAGLWALLGDAVSPTFAIVAALLLLLLRAWALYGDAPGWTGLLHGVAQLVAIVLLTLAGLSLDPFGLADGGVWLAYVNALVVGVVGALLVARVILVAYLWLNQVPGGRAHANEVFAAQSRQAGTRFKHFLRLHISAEGDLTVYAIGLEGEPALIDEPVTVKR